MATTEVINISSSVCYYGATTRSGSGTESTGYNYTTEAKAKAGAQTAAGNTAKAWISSHEAIPAGSYTDSSLTVGTNYSSNWSTGNPTATYQLEPTETGAIQTWAGRCTWTANNTQKTYAVKLRFTIPTILRNLSSSDLNSTISKVEITFTGSSSYSSRTFYMFPPKTANTEQSQYYKYSENTYIDKGNAKSFSSPESTSVTKTEDITALFKKCVLNKNTDNSSWLLIALNADSLGFNNRFTVSNPSIVVTYSYTATGVPGSFSISPAIQVPGGNVTLTWTKPSDGINNTVNGYKIYYVTDSSGTTAPTTSSTAITINSASTLSYTFTIPAAATRGNYYNFKIQSTGSAGSSYYSSLSSLVNSRVNQLPPAPTITTNKQRAKSSNADTSITFTLSSADPDGQSVTYYYGTASDGTGRTEITSPSTLTVNAGTTYYFWAKDSLNEFSSSSSKTLPANTPPTITSTFAMEAVETLIGGTTYDFVKDIKQPTTPTYTYDSAHDGTASYNWYLQFGGNLYPINSWPLDVTTISAMTFGTNYSLAFRVTDDLGEYVTTYSTNTFCIPSIPSVTFYNQWADSSVTNANISHFDLKFRLKYDSKVQFQRTFSFTYGDPVQGPITATSSSSDYQTYDFQASNDYPRGQNITFKIKTQCGNLSDDTATLTIYRAKTISITDFSVTGTVTNFHPYIQEYCNYSFVSDLPALTQANDVSTSFNDVFKFYFVNSNNVLQLNNSVPSPYNPTPTSNTGFLYFNGSNGFVPTLGTNSWASLLGTGTTAPNGQYPIKARITATNLFGTTYSVDQNITIDFGEGFTDTANISSSITIKTGDTTYTNIPIGSHTYPLFETQTLRFSISNVKTYANQAVNISLLEQRGSSSTLTPLASNIIAASNWTNPSSNSHVFTQTNAISIEYVIPKQTANIDVNYILRLSVNNGSSATYDITKSNCKYVKFVPENLNLKFDDVTEELNTFTINWTDDNTDGRDDSLVNLSVITTWSITSTGTYTNIDNTETAIESKTSDNYEKPSTNVVGDIVYLGYKAKYTLVFQEPETGKIPTGTTEYTVTQLSYLEVKSAYTFYRATPNLLYGKNFFVMNASAPVHDDELLTVRPTTGRNKIYIGSTNCEGYFEIAQNDITIDGFTINCGSW